MSPGVCKCVDGFPRERRVAALSLELWKCLCTFCIRFG